jgi:hypothetical protein
MGNHLASGLVEVRARTEEEQRHEEEFEFVHPPTLPAKPAFVKDLPQTRLDLVIFKVEGIVVESAFDVDQQLTEAQLRVLRPELLQQN